MGIITDIKSKLDNLPDAAEKQLSKQANLSKRQLDSIEKKRNDYYAQKADMTADEHQKLISKVIGAIGVEVYHAYLPQISSCYTPIGLDSEFNDINQIAYFNITKWVIDIEESFIDKLVNVYHMLNPDDCSVALIYNQTVSDCNVILAIANNKENDDIEVVRSYRDELIKAINGNFPGAELKYGNKYVGTPDCIKNYGRNKCVASITNTASEKSEKFISQGIEKLLDGIVPQKDEEEYSLILLAEPIHDQCDSKNRLSELYSFLAPYASWQTNYTVSETETDGKAVSLGANLGINASHTKGRGENINVPLGEGICVGKNSFSSNTVGANFGLNFNKSTTLNVSIGKNEGIAQNFVNHNIKHTLEILDEHMKRLEESTALGRWKFASYVISEDYSTTKTAAHMYLALTQGEQSYISQSAINIWHSNEDNDEAASIIDSISRLQHPKFILRNNLKKDFYMYPTAVDATIEISGRELAYALNFPRKSVSGLPVIESVSFGREVHTYDESAENNGSICLGKIYHMRHKENKNVELNIDSLCSHTFITGSTGSGKSNTVYKMLYEIKKQKKKFLVIEPAKGEYKNIFGNDDINVYGTNPDITALLKINPFSFPDEIHILEHLDRLIELFNVCWPMYAAMPAVLKNAVENAYKDCGWDLTKSENEFGSNMYPNFSDVARNVKTIIDSSEYDNENKGAYKGSLLTRLNSLTNGINGLIFSNDTIPENQLFDENVIIDLSRVGSCETKSLIMGILVLKLQEHRMTSGKMNAPLEHITVLEEAHNLLKRTSTVQVSESANLIGKSVEMLTNAIAEMRTYGEGFIIADQAPELLDMAVIRNTNTKIILRLPDKNDRELVGQSANINDNQINELAKLPCGVAAVYQNEWIEPVLCKVDKFEASNGIYLYTKSTTKDDNDIEFRREVAELLSEGTQLVEKTNINRLLDKIKIGAYAKAQCYKYLQDLPSEKVKVKRLAPIMSALFPEVYKAVEASYKSSHDTSDLTDIAIKTLDRFYLRTQGIVEKHIIHSIITDYLLNVLSDKEEHAKWWTENNKKGEVS